MKQEAEKTKWSLVLKTIATVAILIWISTRLDLRGLGHALVAPNWPWLILLMFAGVGFVGVGSIKLWLLVHTLAPVRIQRFTLCFFAASSLSAMLPSIVGDISLLRLLREEGLDIPEGASTMVVDRMVTLVVCIVLFLPLSLVAALGVAPLAAFSGAVSSLLLGGTILWAVERGAERAGSWWGRNRVAHAFPGLPRFVRAVHHLLRRKPGMVLSNLGLTVVRAFISGLTIHLSLLCVGRAPAFWITAAFANAIGVLSLVPVTIAGLGLIEGGGLLLFEAVGLPGEIVVAAFVYHRAAALVQAGLTLAMITAGLGWHRVRGWARPGMDETSIAKR